MIIQSFGVLWPQIGLKTFLEHGLELCLSVGDKRLFAWSLWRKSEGALGKAQSVFSRSYSLGSAGFAV